MGEPLLIMGFLFIYERAKYIDRTISIVLLSVKLIYLPPRVTTAHIFAFYERSIRGVFSLHAHN